MNRILSWFLIALIVAMSGPLQAATMAPVRGFRKSLYGRSGPWADKYAYCSGDPVNASDPSGLQPPDTVQDVRNGQRHIQLPGQKGGRFVVLLYASPAILMGIPGGATFASSMSEGHSLVVALGILSTQHGQEFLDLASGSPIPSKGPISFAQAEQGVARSRLNMAGVELVESAEQDAYGFILREVKNGALTPVRGESGKIQLFLTNLGLQSKLDALKTTGHELFHIRSLEKRGHVGLESEAEAVEYYLHFLYKVNKL
ncbi:MAG: hypothetical protein U0931_29160 [Vulcanimicrobiota bacterium]